ncbi:acetylornithine transaminase [Peribacillus sp. SCS-37]|uniref:acetylornithine transaminase n=1 Tax=Paraperibacillus esterisolvens TaxID=3115296 RepID=UPI003906741C
MSNLFPTYPRWSINPVKGSGVYLTDDSGKRYLDFTSGIGVLNLGHCHPGVSEAVKAQLDCLWHTSNLFPSGIQEETASHLAGLSGLRRVFFANSGAEANEAAIKLSRKATGRSKVITFLQSFHGRTFAAMAATGQEKVRTGYGDMLQTFHYAKYNDIQSVEEAADSDTAAIMLEVVQGEGGIHIADPQFLKRVEEICRETGALFVIDEIQTGIGRTGKPFAFQHFDLNPDIITLAKGLGNGLPVGAMCGREELAEAFGPGSHGSTFGGNPVCLASARAVLEEIGRADFLNDVEDKGRYLRKSLDDALKDCSVVKEIRNLGLMAGIELNEEAGPYLNALQNLGLLVLTAGTHVLRLLPPLTVSTSEIDEAAGLIAEVLAKKPQAV